MARPGRRRSESSRQQIIEATLQGLMEMGFSALTVESIANRAGVSKATIYRWWPNKAWLVMEVLRELSTTHLDQPQPGGLRQALLHKAEQWNLFCQSSAGLAFQAVLHETSRDPELSQAYLEGYLEPRRQRSRALFVEAQARGELDPSADPEEMIDALYGPLYYRQIVRKQAPCLEFSRRIVESFLRCYAPL